MRAFTHAVDVVCATPRKRLLKRAFTLAEVLVTLGIVGVVSALTIPSLVKNHQRQAYVTQLKKVVSELSQAAEKSINDNNAVSLAETKYGGAGDDTAVRNFFLDNFKITNDCKQSLTPCFADKYKSISGDELEIRFGKTFAVFSLANGASIYVFGMGMTDDGDVLHGGYHGYYQLVVDINGSQGPNIMGRDLFYMELYSDGKIAGSYEPDTKSDDDWNLEACQDGWTYGVGCITKIMHDGWKMDY